MKTILIQTYKLNKEKYMQIYKYSVMVRQIKNKVSQYIYNNCLYEVLNGYISSRYLYKIVSHLKPTDMLASTFQLLCGEVYICYVNNKNNYLKFNKSKNQLDDIIHYLCKVINPTEDYQTFIQTLSKMNKNSYGKSVVLPRINKIIYNIALNKQSLLKLKSKPIKFTNNGFDFKNILQYKPNQTMFELSNNKFTNAVINLNIRGLLVLPFRYSKTYHNDIINNQGGITYRNTKKGRVGNQQQYIINIKPIEDKQEIKISIAVDSINQTPVYENITDGNTIGIDVNLKHDIINISNGDSIPKNTNQLKKAIRLQNKVAHIQRTKQKQHKVKETYGKQITKQINRNSNRNKYYNDYYAYLLKQYCKQHNISNVVMEDLNLQGKLRTTNKETNLKYSNLINILHINDLKNAIPRILNKVNINTHFVNPEYTSQTCPICGYIYKPNRLNQETFSCKKCSYTNNADTNAAYNIKQRVVNDYYRNNLEVYENNHYIPKFKKHIKSNKVIYEEVYNFICSNTNAFSL